MMIAEIPDMHAYLEKIKTLTCTSILRRIPRPHTRTILRHHDAVVGFLELDILFSDRFRNGNLNACS